MGTWALILAARIASELCWSIALETERAQGMPGAGLAHGCVQQSTR
jgi:hypothetical protein